MFRDYVTAPMAQRNSNYHEDLTPQGIEESIDELKATEFQNLSQGADGSL